MNRTAKRSRGPGALRAIYVFICGVLITALPAQDPTPPQPEPVSDPASVAPAKVQPATVQPATVLAANGLGQITADISRVRCFASDLSPSYEGELPKGTVVQVGDAVGEYRRVILPLGVIGYVSKRFTSLPIDGRVTTERDLVSFRYRPTPSNRAEAPVQNVPKATVMRYLGEVGDWWKVRFETDSAFVPIKEIAVTDQPDDDLQAAYEALRQTHETEWQVAAASFQKALAVIAERTEREKRLGELRAAFQVEAGKQLRAQELAPIRDKLTGLIGELPKDDPMLATAKFLESAIQRQQVFIDADKVMNAEEPAPPVPTVRLVETPKDRLYERLNTIGWLSYHPGSAGPTAYRLEKGGRVIAYLSCNSLRYDLALFAGVEIGVRGVRRQDGSISYLEVEKVEVLGHAR